MMNFLDDCGMTMMMRTRIRWRQDDRAKLISGGSSLARQSVRSVAGSSL